MIKFTQSDKGSKYIYARVKRVTGYKDFTELFAKEGVEKTDGRS